MLYAKVQETDIYWWKNTNIYKISISVACLKELNADKMVIKKLILLVWKINTSKFSREQEKRHTNRNWYAQFMELYINNIIIENLKSYRKKMLKRAMFIEESSLKKGKSKWKG